jgi:protein O-mannosyl-transferase
MKQVMHGLSLGLRIENALVSYARYFSKIIWPDNLSIIYPHPGVWPRVTVYFSAAVLLIITLAVVANIRRRPYLAVGWCWFLGVLVPVIGVVQVGIQAMADRFAYIPVIGIFVAFVWLAADWVAANPAKSWIPRLATAAILGVCAVTTWFQLSHWKNSETVLTHAAKVTVRNFMAHLNLAVLYMDRGQTNRVAYHATEALRGNPNVHEALILLGYTREAAKDFPGAVSNYHRALSIAPDSYPARTALATVLATQGDYESAEAELLKLARANPSNPEVPNSLAGVCLKQQKPEKALTYYRTALELNPASPSVLNNIAWLLATCPDAKVRNGHEAVRYAERACELTQRSVPVLLGTLAAAYAEAGRFDDAVRTAEEARDLAQEAGNTQIAETNGKLLQLYRAKTPYREGQQPL